MSCFISACEPSADILGADVIKTLYEGNRNPTIIGIGGVQMQSICRDQLISNEGYAALGMSLKSGAKIFFLKRLLIKMIEEANPNVVLLIDFPTLHLNLARSLRKRGFSGIICQYVCPSIWAYHAKRKKTLEAYYDRLFLLFDFEKKLFLSSPLQTDYVGHPLMRSLPDVVRLEERPPLLTLFPGSRAQDIARMLPAQLAVAKQLQQAEPSLHFAIALYSNALRPLVEKEIKKQNIRIEISTDKADLLKKSRWALAKSGTITLELALHKVPTLVHFGLYAIEMIIKRRLENLWIALPNLLADEVIFPEHIHAKYAKKLLYHALKELTVTSMSATIEARCEKIRTLVTSQPHKKSVGEEIALLLHREK